MKTEIPTKGIRVMKYHARHCSVINTGTSPIKKMWESTMGMGEHHVNNRNPETECKQWLTDNGYETIPNSEFWTKIN